MVCYLLPRLFVLFLIVLTSFFYLKNIIYDINNRRNINCCVRCYVIICDYCFNRIYAIFKKSKFTNKNIIDINSIRNLTGGNNDRFITIDNDIFYKSKAGAIVKLPRYYPQVGVLTNHIFYQHQPDDFVYLEKTDGERTLILIDDNDIYKLTTYPKLSLSLLLTIEDDTNILNGFSLLDAELYNNKYYVFDAYAVDNVLIYDYNYINRMKRINDFIDNQHNNNLLNDVFIKQYYEVTKQNLNDIINMINTTDYSNDTGNKIDGVVFQLVNSPYINDENKPTPDNTTTFKLKKRTLNTIDFLLKYDNNKQIYYLYLQNKLFKCPYFYNLNKLNINQIINNWNQNGYNNEQITEINELISDMVNDPNKYNNVIVELSLTYSNYWVPIRVRTDKIYSNSYKVGISNSGVIFSPLALNESYFTKDFNNSPFDTSLRSEYHDTNKYIRQYIFNELFALIKQHDNLSLLDICGGRGGDVKYYLSNGVNDIYVIDGDKPALTQYVDRYYNRCNINARYIILDENEEKTNKLIKHIQYYKQQFDIIIMNYAFHYLCDNDNKIINLKHLILSLLKPNGFILFSFFDGDKLIKNLPIKNFDNIQPCDDNINCLMALPTIDPTGYRIEPLVKRHHIDLLTSNDDNNSSLNIIKEFYPLENLLIDHKELYNDVSDYLINIKTIILTKYN